jgi:MtN3 and saliva related transmembrane protein
MSHDHDTRRVIDRLIYVVVIGGPLMNVPQLYKIIIHKNAMGVSAISWMAFAIGSLLWLSYGIVHRDKPIICMNAVLVIMQTLIAVSTVIYG